MQGPGVEDLARAADVLVKALRVSPGERFAAIGDNESQPILAALDAAAKRAGADAVALRLDVLRSTATNHSGERPHKVLPDAVRRALLAAQASVFVASSPHAETSMRDQVVHIVGACRIRHAHLPGITRASFAAGLQVESERIAEIGKKVAQRLERDRNIVVESNEGTRLTAHASAKWISRVGSVKAGEVVCFPTGSLISCPDNVSGTFVATASLGEFFGAREGLLRTPVTFEIAHGRVVRVSCPGNDQLAQDVEQMLHVAPNSDRVGLLVLGLNDGIAAPTGDASVDQHRPGLHLVFGDPAPRLTGASWNARTTFAACQSQCTVKVDGETVIDDGKLVT